MKAVCTRCGARAEADTVEELEQAVPGHPFLTGRCPTPNVVRWPRPARSAA